eukprot:gene30779-35818_t
MGSDPVSLPGVSFIITNRNAVFGTLAATAATYFAYKAYHSETASLLRKINVIASNYADAMVKASSATSLLASDLNAYLKSNGDDLPASVKQACKLLQSAEVQESLGGTVSTVVQSAVKASSRPAAEEGGSGVNGPTQLDKILEVAFGDPCQKLVAMVVKTAVDSGTGTYCDYMERIARNPPPPGPVNPATSPAAILSLVASEEGEKLLSFTLKTLIETGIVSYVDAYKGYNMYEDVVASISTQDNRDAITDLVTRITGSFVKEAAGAYQSVSAAAAAATAASLPAPDSVSSKNGKGGAAPPEWLHGVVSVIKEKDVRALAVDVVGSASREVVRGTLETLIYGRESSRPYKEGLRSTGSLGESHFYALITICIALFMFSMAPHALSLTG